ncbi:copper resistance CopC family protein [Sanguibacter sp. 25GB23B1]|uniref:copper resistance CopC family protein n=1 Tax=unclassified Sanguibacter TaxID=2645534 RepID=UPI0032AF2B42
MRNHVARLLALLLAICGMAVITTAPASAHDSIISSDPADGAELATSPAQITLTFTDEIQPVGGQVLLVDSAGTQVAAGVPTVDGVTAAFVVPTLANGPYSVTWRVVSSDGHPIDGTFGFSVADPGAVGVEPAPEVTALDVPAEPPTDATPQATATDEPSPSSDPTVTAEDGAADDDAAPPWPGIIIGGLLGLAAGIGLLQWSKRRKNTDRDDR